MRMACWAAALVRWRSCFQALRTRPGSWGAVPIRMGLDSRLERVGYAPFPQRDLRRWGYSMSRPLLEQVVRQFVARDRRIEIRAGSPAREILASPDRGGVSAVWVAKHGGAAEIRIVGRLVQTFP